MSNRFLNFVLLLFITEKVISTFADEFGRETIEGTNFDSNGNVNESSPSFIFKIVFQNISTFGVESFYI